MANSRNKTFKICFIGLMAAIVFVVNYFRIPFMGTQLHMTNALCVLCGLLFGPSAGFLAAGIGSGLYDIVAGWGAECVITFINKGAIALVAGLIGYPAARKDESVPECISFGQSCKFALAVLKLFEGFFLLLSERCR